MVVERGGRVVDGLGRGGTRFGDETSPHDSVGVTLRKPYHFHACAEVVHLRL